jgi:predicted DNA-binding transcriptional regulator AlpA
MAEQVISKEEVSDVKVMREGEYDLLSLYEARKMLGIGQNKMYELVNTGQIPYISGFGGKKIRKGAIYDFILQHERFK